MTDLNDLPNPFGNEIITSAWEPISDVEDIHAPAYEMCLKLLQKEVRLGKRKCSLLIYGPSGCGKTHLAARLRRHFRQPKATEAFCWISLEDCAADHLWSRFRERLVADLVRPSAEGPTQLSKLVCHRLAVKPGSNDADSSLLIQLLGMIGGTQKQSIAQQLKEKLFPVVSLPGEFRTALLLIFGDNADKAKDAAAWLQGDSYISEDRLAVLGLPREQLNDQEREQQSKAVVLGLCRLSSPSHPLVLCLDQIEGLQSIPIDLSKFLKFGQKIAAIRDDSHGSVMLVSFIRNTFRDALKNGAGESYWARIAQNEVGLTPLTESQAFGLVKLRLKALDSHGVKRPEGADEFWPLSRKTVEAIFRSQHPSCMPRSLLHACKEVFRPIVVVDPLSLVLQSKWDERRAHRTINIDAERFDRLIEALPWLCSMLQTGHAPVERENLKQDLPDIRKVLRNSTNQLTALCACLYSPQSWHRYKRVAEHWEQHTKLHDRCQHLIVVYDKPPAPKTKSRDHFDRLVGLPGVDAVCPEPKKVIALDALFSLLKSAMVGDLTCNGADVSADQVDQWARDSIAEPMHPIGVLKDFLDDLRLHRLDTTPPPTNNGAPKPAPAPIHSSKVS
jgi:hypothetical protein